VRGDVNTDAWSTMTTTGYEQSDADTVINVSAVHDSTEVGSVGSTHAPIVSMPSTDTFIAALLMWYACVTISGLVPIGATTSEIHVVLQHATTHSAYLALTTYLLPITYYEYNCVQRVFGNSNEKRNEPTCTKLR